MKLISIVFCFPVFAVLFFTGCSSTWVIRSEPSEAEVFVRHPEKSERLSLGKTPLEMTQAELQEKAQISPTSADFFEVTIEKQDHLPEKLLVPLSRMGTRETFLTVKLQPGQQESRLAQRILQLMFNAQKFAQQREFVRAHEEIDKALSLDSRFSRALSLKASIYFLQQNYSEALKFYEEALKSEPGFDDANKMIVQIRQLQSTESRMPSSVGVGP